jgi:hypothetical protein
MLDVQIARLAPEETERFTNDPIEIAAVPA